MTSPRQRKVAERIHEIVATLVDRRLKDPRLGMVTITDVRVTGDLQHATVFYTVLGEEAQLRSSAAALESARGMIRSEVGRQLGLRLTPTLEFVADALPESARTLEDALVALAGGDEELAKLRESAAPAGEADPYRKPAQRDEAPDGADDPAGESPEAETSPDGSADDRPGGGTA